MRFGLQLAWLVACGTARHEPPKADVPSSVSDASVDTCDRARRCYREMSAALGVKPRERAEFGANPSPSDCERAITAAVRILRDENKPIPDACN